MTILTNSNVATLVNNVYGNITGENDSIVTEDLNNIVDIGIAISDGITSDNFRNIATGLFDSIGAIVYSTVKPTEFSSYNITVPYPEYGSIIEKVSLNMIDFEETEHFAMSGGSTFSDMFDYHNPEVNARAYNQMSAFRTKPYSIGINRFKSAFRSESDLLKMLAEITNMITTMYMYTVKAIEKRVVNQLISSTTYNNTSRCINLLEVYESETGVTETVATYRKNSDFIKWAFAHMNKISDLMSMVTDIYNDGSRVINTTADDRRAIMVTDFKRLIDTNVLSSAYNPEYIADNEWIVVPCLQSATQRDKIDIVPAGVHSITSGKHITRVQISNVIGAIFDKRGACCCATQIRTGVQANDFDEHINYIHKFNMREYVDETENAVLFTVADKSSGTWGKAYTITEVND